MLIDADEPLGRSAIIERAGISASSYDRNIDELAAVGVVESVGNGGHKQWQGWILPWWSPLADVERPRTADDSETTLAPPSRWDDVLYEIAVALGLDPGYDLFANPVAIEAVFDALPALNRWRGFVLGHYGLSTDARTFETLTSDTHTVAVGVGQFAVASVEPEQANLLAGDDGGM